MLFAPKEKGRAPIPPLICSSTRRFGHGRFTPLPNDGKVSGLGLGYDAAAL